VTNNNPPETEAEIRDRLLATSGSFRKKEGRHELRTRDVIYCAFSTPNFTVTKEEAQRDAPRRLKKFGLTARKARGKTALDLGANAGAMLFEANNLGIASGLGIEFDQEKMTLATEIAALSNLDNLRFEQGDIDELDAEKLGTFDIVFALAIEAHVNDPDRLYRLLGQVASDTLYFEGNGNCDMDEVAAQLKAAGFVKFKSLGFCDDDRKRSNNNRPMLVARKKKNWFRRSR
jgi:2-polyprenyl-3-methyl-5-hydroxy-6-metoxy-1,4-benzoquinol methylase